MLNKLLIILSFQFIVCTLVFLNIPIARQVVGFFYLTIVPGFLLLRTLKLGKLDMTETVLFSVGLSIALLMFTGLLINELYPLIGIPTPLSVVPLIVTISTIIFLLGLVNFFRDTGLTNLLGSRDFRLSYLPLLLILCLPLLGAIGTMLVNIFENNLLLLLVIIISGLIFLGTLFEKVIPSRFFPLVLFAITLSLLCFVNASLITRYIVGWEIHEEFYVFRLTEINNRWNSIPPSDLDFRILKGYNMMSVTILPTIYSEILNLDGTWIFKIIYPLIVSFITLGAYQLFCTQTDKKTAFLATFFFISFSMDYGWGSNKQLIAQFYYVLSFLVLFKKEMPSFERKITFIVFSLIVIISHYSLTYIFMFILLFTWLSSHFIKNKTNINPKRVSMSIVMIFCTLTFSWYIVMPGSISLVTLTVTVNSVIRHFFFDFFNPQSRGETVLRGLGVTTEAVSFFHQIGRILFHLTEFFIIVGFVECIRPFILKGRKKVLDPEYVLIICANMTMLLMSIIIPNLAASFCMERFFQTALIFISPLCIIGGKTILRYLLKLKTQNLALILALTILIPLFLFNTGFIYEVTKDKTSAISLSMYRLKNEVEVNQIIVTEQEVLGAKWLSNHATTNARVYADYISNLHVLTSYGMISRERLQLLSNTTRTLDNGGFVYLRRLNSINGIMEDNRFRQWDTYGNSSILKNQNIIYSNGECEIYKGV